MHSSYMEFDFGQLHYSHSNSRKKTTIIFLHSFNSSATSFAKISELLKDHFSIYCLDFPGHGLSARIDVNQYGQYCSMDGLSSILIEFVDRLQLKDIVMVGNSMGGNAAVRAMPSLKTLDALILMGSIQAATTEQLFKIMYATAPLDILFKNKLSEQEIEVLAKAYVYQSETEKDSFKQMKNDIKKTDGNFREQFARSIELQAWTDELQLIKNCTIPLLYILGVQDGFINTSDYKKLLLEAGLQEPQLQLLEHVSHVPHLDNPNLCARLILEFIDGVP